MRAVDCIIKKRDGHRNSDEELRFLIDGVVSGDIPKYQAAAWLMAAFHHSLDFEELGALTRAMIVSGDEFDLSSINGVKVDKHSTGGVGDKVSLILAPLAASAGVNVPMVSGRSLGHTGGTLDKLESIDGYNTRLDGEAFARQVADIGCAIIGQTGNFVPADKILYSLRDVTGTVESVPLISASIMSKKVASGADAFVMDVKSGTGAFMATEERARELAESLKGLGEALGKRVVCLITDMNQPLGKWVGNRVEAAEAIAVLKGTGEKRLTRLCLTLGAWMMRLAGIEEDLKVAQKVLAQRIIEGDALAKFAEMVEAQGGDADVARNPRKLEIAKNVAHFRSPRAGFIGSYDTRAIGVASMLLGGGRESVEDEIDPAVGILVRNQIGDQMMNGEPLMSLYYNDEAKHDAALAALEGCTTISDDYVEAPEMVKAVIE